MAPDGLAGPLVTRPFCVCPMVALLATWFPRIKRGWWIGGMTAAVGSWRAGCPQSGTGPVFPAPLGEQGLARQLGIICRRWRCSFQPNDRALCAKPRRSRQPVPAGNLPIRNEKWFDLFAIRGSLIVACTSGINWLELYRCKTPCSCQLYRLEKRPQRIHRRQLYGDDGLLSIAAGPLWGWLI